MATFATMLPGFARLAASLTGLAVTQVVHAHMPTKAIDPQKKTRMEFRIIACRSVASSNDEIRYTFDEDTEFLHTFVYGVRVVTIQVKFEGYDHSPGKDALYYLERLGNRIVWPSSLAALRVLEMGLVSRMPALDVSAVLSAEDREWSVGVKDFIFNAVVGEEADAPDDDNPGWIETVEFYSDELVGTDGLAIDQQIEDSVTRP